MPASLHVWRAQAKTRPRGTIPRRLDRLLGLRRERERNSERPISFANISAHRFAPAETSGMPCAIHSTAASSGSRQRQRSCSQSSRAASSRISRAIRGHWACKRAEQRMIHSNSSMAVYLYEHTVCHPASRLPSRTEDAHHHIMDRSALRIRCRPSSDVGGLDDQGGASRMTFDPAWRTSCAFLHWIGSACQGGGPDRDRVSCAGICPIRLAAWAGSR